MSVKALEALQVIELLDRQDKCANIASIEPAIFQKKLEYYRNDRLRNAAADIRSTISDKRDLAALISSVSAANALEPLLPSAFVYSRLYTNDPLLRFATPSDSFTDAHNRALGLRTDRAVNPQSVANAVWYFELLAPLIRCGVITVLPIAELHAPPDERPINFSEDWFRSEVPEHLHDFVHQQAIIREVSPAPDGAGLIIHRHAPTKPTRGISVAFNDDFEGMPTNFYLLSETKEVERLGENQVRLGQTFDFSNPPDQSLFDAWMYQSVNRTIIDRLSSMAREFELAEQLHATYLTESKFEVDLCAMSFETMPNSSRQERAVNFLHANAVYLDMDALSLARLRMEQPRLFERWQLTLMDVADRLTGRDDDFEEQAKQLFEKEVMPQVEDLRKSLWKIGGAAGGAGLVGTGSIAMALISNATLPLAAVLGAGALVVAGQTLPTVAEYLSKRRGPSFIWNRLTM